MRYPRFVRLFVLCVFVLGCGDDATGSDAGTDAFDAGPVGECTTLVPGLYAADCVTPAVGVRRYRPMHELWADASDKERFLALPPGGVIDASDPDAWVFPAGTRIYKTFSLDGVRLETRVMEKVGGAPGHESWNFRVYLWSEDQLSVTETTGELVSDVLGTDHDVPSQMQCVMCHSAVGDAVNGLATVQIDASTIDEWFAEGALAPRPDYPGIPGDASAQAALGYLHANCGHCHHPDAAEDSGLYMNLSASDLAVEDTAAYTTSVGVMGTWIDVGATIRIVAGDPDASTLVRRMESRDPVAQMPPISTEQVDASGVGILRAWISGL